MSEDDPPADRDREPLGDLVDEVERRRTDEESDLFEEAFEDMDLEVDSEAVWERLESDEQGAAPPEGDEERVVDKTIFCQRCEYFSDPPAMACDHEGTEILELVDVEHLRVVNCPIVAERERLEGME